MKNILNFLLDIGRLKGKERRGWLLHEIKKSESTAEHMFRTALLAWILGKEKGGLNWERLLKMALIHDICEVYAFDATPYDPLLPKSLKKRKKIREILKKWPKFSLFQKQKRELAKYKDELKGLEKLISHLPSGLKTEIKGLWLDYENGLTKEGRFVKQVDKVENYLQGIEYWKKQGKIQYKLWKRWSREIIDDPILLELLRTIDQKFFTKNLKKFSKKRINSK